MQLYAGSSSDFIQSAAQNQIADRLQRAFERHYRYRPSPAEVGSWRNSLRAISQVVDNADLDDHGVMLEYQLPLTSKRLDCMIMGRDRSGHDQAVIVELKQWEKSFDTEGRDLVRTYTGGAERDVLHPSRQVGQYQSDPERFHRWKSAHSFKFRSLRPGISRLAPRLWPWNRCVSIGGVAEHRHVVEILDPSVPRRSPEHVLHILDVRAPADRHRLAPLRW